MTDAVELDALRLECQRLRDENSRLHKIIETLNTTTEEESTDTDQQPDMVCLTRDMLHDGKTGNGGYNRKQIEALGLRYPVKKGWLSRLVGKTIPRERYERYLALNTEVRVEAGEIKPRKKARRMAEA